MLSRHRAIALVHHSYLYYVGYDISRPQDVKTLRRFCRASENRALQHTSHEPIPTLMDNDWAWILDAPTPFGGRSCCFFIDIFPVIAPTNLTLVLSARRKLSGSLHAELVERHKTEGLRQLGKEYNVTYSKFLQ